MKTTLYCSSTRVFDLSFPLETLLRHLRQAKKTKVFSSKKYNLLSNTEGNTERIRVDNRDETT